MPSAAARTAGSPAAPPARTRGGTPGSRRCTAPRRPDAPASTARRRGVPDASEASRPPATATTPARTAAARRRRESSRNWCGTTGTARSTPPARTRSPSTWRPARCAARYAGSDGSSADRRTPARRASAPARPRPTAASAPWPADRARTAAPPAARRSTSTSARRNTRNPRTAARHRPAAGCAWPHRTDPARPATPDPPADPPIHARGSTRRPPGRTVRSHRCTRSAC